MPAHSIWALSYASQIRSHVISFGLIYPICLRWKVLYTDSRLTPTRLPNSNGRDMQSWCTVLVAGTYRRAHNAELIWQYFPELLEKVDCALSCQAPVSPDMCSRQSFLSCCSDHSSAQLSSATSSQLLEYFNTHVANSLVITPSLILQHLCREQRDKLVQLQQIVKEEGSERKGIEDLLSVLNSSLNAMNHRVAWLETAVVQKQPRSGALQLLFAARSCLTFFHPLLRCRSVLRYDE